MKAILTYHSIDDSGSPISMAPTAFREHIDFFMSRGIPIVPVDALLDDRERRSAVAITFDDGYDNLQTMAAPVLARHGVTATIFVPTGFVGRTNEWAKGDAYDVPQLPLLDWDALGALQESGFAIGSHSRHHRHLTALSDAEIDEEVEGAASDIAAHLGVRAGGFAYPYGEVSDAARSAVGRSHAWACTTTMADLSDEDRLALPRLEMWYFQQPHSLDEWGTPAFSRWIRRREVLRRVRAVVRKVVGR